MVCSAGRGGATWTVLPARGGGTDEDDGRDGSGGGREVEFVRLDKAPTDAADVLLGGGSKGGGGGLVELFAALRGGGGGGGGFPLYGSQFVLAIGTLANANAIRNGF